MSGNGERIRRRSEGKMGNVKIWRYEEKKELRLCVVEEEERDREMRI